MRITTILGSPKRHGNTAKVLGLFEEQMRSRGAEVDRIHIMDHQVRGCLGCGACQRIADEPACVQKDDAEAILRRMMASDAVIYASPLYGWDFSAQLKALLDRHFCLVTGYGGPNFRSLLAGKGIGLLITCSWSIEHNADLVQVMFDRLNAYLRSRLFGKYIVPNCTTPDAMGDRALEIAARMAEDIGKG